MYTFGDTYKADGLYLVQFCRIQEAGEIGRQNKVNKKRAKRWYYIANP